MKKSSQYSSYTKPNAFIKSKTYLSSSLRSSVVLNNKKQDVKTLPRLLGSENQHINNHEETP